MVYTKGFHPKPDMVFGPALSLGVMSLDEYADLRFAADLDPEALARLTEQMTQSSPKGLAFRDAVKLEPADPGITRAVAGARYVIAFAREALPLDEQALAARCAAAMAATSLPYRRQIDGVGKMLDVRTYLLRAEVAGEEARAALARAGLVGDLVAVDVDCAISPSGAVKAAEVAAVIAGDRTVTAPPHRAVRVALFRPRTRRGATRPWSWGGAGASRAATGAEVVEREAEETGPRGQLGRGVGRLSACREAAR